MLKKDAIGIICYCLEYPKTLENPEYKRIYEEARKTIGAFEREKRKNYEEEKIFFDYNQKLEQEVKEILEKEKAKNEQVMEMFGLNAKQVMYVRRKYHIVESDIGKEELKETYYSKGIKGAKERFGVSDKKLYSLLSKYHIKAIKDVTKVVWKVTFKNGKQKSFNSPEEVAKLFGIKSSAIYRRARMNLVVDGVKIEKTEERID